MQYSEKVRQKVVELIAPGELSIPEICDKLGITGVEFVEWVKEIPDFKESVRIATEVKYDNRLSMAWRAQRRLIEGYSYTETSEEVEGIQQENGTVVEFVKSRKTSTKHVKPSASAVLHALKSLDPRMNPTERFDHTTGGDPITSLPNIFLNIPATAKSLEAADSN
jgi:hypothetical protein